MWKYWKKNTWWITVMIFIAGHWIAVWFTSVGIVENKACLLDATDWFFFVFFQTHPNVDKKMFNSSSCIQLKNPEKPFPLHQDVGVLKWRYTTQDESNMPLSSESNYSLVQTIKKLIKYVSKSHIFLCVIEQKMKKYIWKVFVHVYVKMHVIINNVFFL